MTRPQILAGNWKMHKTQAQARDFLTHFVPQVQHWDRRVILCVPFTDLAAVSEHCHGSQVYVGAQNIHWEDTGAYTGEISGAMLAELGTSHVIVGHSERRQYFGETDATVNRRLLAAQRHDLTPILCVGESREVRHQGHAESWILSQLRQGLVGIDLERLIVAYEPIWAIGTGETCQPTEANRVISVIRENLSNSDVPILYGGSVKANNIDELMAQPQIDGVLVGGGSLDPVEFARIINFQTLASVPS